MNTEPDFRKLILKIALDITCVLLVGVPIYIFYAFGKPYERGFFCDDESLRHPYHSSTVPGWSLYLGGFVLPIATIIVVEYLIYYQQKGMRTRIKLLSARLPSWVWESYKYVGLLFFGAGCTTLLTDVGKYTVGRLRPHFFDVCKPDIDCDDPKNKYAYITNFKCQEKNERRLKEMRLSFPSGHSSFSTFCMIYLVMYLHVKVTWKGSTLLKHVFQYICIMLAFFTALSRISDYKHHWSDVLAGSFQGFVVAILIIAFVSDLWKQPIKYGVSEPSSDENMQNNMAMN